MRNRLMIATVAVLLLVPASAFADNHVEVDCYADPTNPACSEVEEHVEKKPEPEVEEATVEVLGTSLEAELAETGVSATLFAVIASLMLGAGALLLVASRRRGTAA